MKFLFLVGLALFCIFALIFGQKYFKKDAVYVLAFGFAIGSNVYNIGNFGFDIGGYLFGIDSVIYTMFVFCVLLTYLIYGKKDTKSLVLSVMCSILLTGLLQFVASWASVGFSSGLLWGLGSFAISAVATVVAIWIGIAFIEAIKNKNSRLEWLSVLIFFIVVCVVNSLIYFGGVAIFNQINFDLGNVLVASYIGKIFTTALCFVAYFLFYTKAKREKLASVLSKIDQIDESSN